MDTAFFEDHMAAAWLNESDDLFLNPQRKQLSNQTNTDNNVGSSTQNLNMTQESNSMSQMEYFYENNVYEDQLVLPPTMKSFSPNFYPQEPQPQVYQQHLSLHSSQQHNQQPVQMFYVFFPVPLNQVGHSKPNGSTLNLIMPVGGQNQTQHHQQQQHVQDTTTTQPNTPTNNNTSIMGSAQPMTLEALEHLRKQLERKAKIEKFKAKKRNWIRKVRYTSRSNGSFAKFRIKGRFLSKKDCETILEKYGDAIIKTVGNCKELDPEKLSPELVKKYAKKSKNELRADRLRRAMEKSILRNLHRRRNMFKIIRN